MIPNPSTLMDAKTRLFLVRGAVLFYFCLEGSLIGLWTAYVPHVQDHLNISDTLLGSAILFFYLGQVLGSPLAGLCLHYFGAKNSTGVGAILYATFLPVVAQANSFATLCLVFFTWGSAEVLLDVSMNTSGVIAEVEAGFPIVGFFHGSYSISAAVGGVIGSALISKGYRDTNVYLFAMGISLLFISLSYYIYYDMDEERKIMATMDVATTDSMLGNTDVSATVSSNYNTERDSKDTVGSDRDRIISNSSETKSTHDASKHTPTADDSKDKQHEEGEKQGNEEEETQRDDEAWHPLVWKDRKSIDSSDPESMHTHSQEPPGKEKGSYTRRDILDLLMIPRSVDLFVLSCVGKRSLGFLYSVSRLLLP